MCSTGLSPPTIPSRVTTPQLKTVPHAQVAPILQSDTPDILLSETDAEYVIPEEKYQNSNHQGEGIKKYTDFVSR